MKPLFSLILSIVFSQSYACNYEQLILNHVVKNILIYIAPTMRTENSKNLQIYFIPELRFADCTKGVFSSYSVYSMFEDSMSKQTNTFHQFDYLKGNKLKSFRASKPYDKNPENIYTDKNLFNKFIVIIQIYSRIVINKKIYVLANLTYPSGNAVVDVLFEIEEKDGKIIREYIMSGIN